LTNREVISSEIWNEDSVSAGVRHFCNTLNTKQMYLIHSCLCEHQDSVHECGNGLANGGKCFHSSRIDFDELPLFAYMTDYGMNVSILFSWGCFTCEHWTAKDGWRRVWQTGCDICCGSSCVL